MYKVRWKCKILRDIYDDDDFDLCTFSIQKYHVVVWQNEILYVPLNISEENKYL